jgi:hypothetical protein
MLISVSGIDKPLIFQINSVEVGRFTGSAGALSLPVTGSAAGIKLGTATQFDLYQHASSVGRTSGSLIIDTGIAVGHTTVTLGVGNFNVGLRIANAAALGHTLQGDGTNFVSKEPDFLLQQVFN